jgi:cellulose synthase/poly-beta-1,6-N-acetylglucosamine synthase-like glycosyltransferase
MTAISIFLIIYHHAGYPLMLRLLGNKRRDADIADNCTQATDLPSITILLPAFNEERHIADKIRNLAFLDYPRDKLRILIASDGSTDSTFQKAIATLNEPECRDCNIQVIEFNQNRGKVAILNRMICAIDSEILALSDISALISIDALKLAAQRFSDPRVAVVNGHYRLLVPSSVRTEPFT